MDFLEGSIERIEDEAEFLKGDGAQERAVIGLSEDDGSVGSLAAEGDLALGYVPIDSGAIREREIEPSSRFQTQRHPVFAREYGVECPTVDEEVELSLTERGRNRGVNAGQSHGIPPCLFSIPL